MFKRTLTLMNYFFFDFCFGLVLFFYIGCSRKEITEHWEWLEQNLLQTLSIFENENDINTFVRGKIQVVYLLVQVLLMINMTVEEELI